MISRIRVMGKNFLFFIILILASKITITESNIGVEPASRRLLKILCVFEKFPVLPELYAINLATGFIDRGLDVSILAEEYGQDIAHPAVEQYKLMERIYYKDLPSDIQDYDIILCQFGPMGEKFVEIKKELGLKAKIVTCFRGFDVSRYITIHGEHVYDSLFEQGDFFLPVCKYFQDVLVRLGCPADKICVHHSAIDLKRFVLKDTKKDDNTAENENIKDRKITIVTADWFYSKKGIIYAIPAIAALLKKYPHIEYIIMGSGPLEEVLKKAISVYEISDNVKLLEWGNHDAVLQLLNQADIFVLPAVTDELGDEEGIPNCLKEAMAVGVPVVSTYHGGISELVENGKTGFLVESKSVSQLAEKIEYLINNRQEARAMGLAGHDHVQEEYDTEKLNDQLVEIFYKLLD